MAWCTDVALPLCLCTIKKIQMMFGVEGLGWIETRQIGVKGKQLSSGDEKLS